jgi:large subunit ribosomal protein L4e
MFAPTKTWRKWHVKVPVNQKRYATVSALAASAVPALVMARGHRVDRVPEIPLVLDNKLIDGVDKTKKAVALLKAINAYDDVERVIDSHKIRVGKGKLRNRRYVQRRGPLVIYNEKGPLVKAFRNVPGIELVSVQHLNLLQLAPGAHLGRFIIWTKDAFQRLDSIYGTQTRPSSEKNGYLLPKSVIGSTDIGRIMSSDEIQSVLRNKNPTESSVHRRRKNIDNNIEFYKRLNPYIQTLRRREIKYSAAQHKKKQEAAEALRKGTKKQEKKKAPSATHLEFTQLLYSK